MTEEDKQRVEEEAWLQAMKSCLHNLAAASNEALKNAGVTNMMLTVELQRLLDQFVYARDNFNRLVARRPQCLNNRKTPSP